MKYVVCLLLLLVAFAFNISLLAQPYRPTLDIRVPNTPVPVNINDKPTVYYELYVTNFSPDTVHLTSLGIFKNNRDCYRNISGDELSKRLYLVGVKNEAAVEPFIYPGATVIIYIELVLKKEDTNMVLLHHIQFSFTGKEAAHEDSIVGARTQLLQQPAIVLSNPLQGGPWCAVYEPSWTRGHRRVLFTVNGKAHLPGRFAIDFIKLNEKGKYALENEDSIHKWLGYDASVLAVADGVIAAAMDTFSESPTLSGHPKYSSDKATGNYISLKIGESQFVFYEHLKPKSIKVNPGQLVKKGDEIASLGFTGQTTGPHLHLHVADVNSPLSAEGLPFIFDSFELLGSYDNFDDFGKNTWTKPVNNSAVYRQKQRPQPKAVIVFKN
jgi:hypothetical protein